MMDGIKGSTPVRDASAMTASGQLDLLTRGLSPTLYAMPLHACFYDSVALRVVTSIRLPKPRGAAHPQVVYNVSFW